MCGIAGIINVGSNCLIEELNCMLMAMSNRGPDNQGTWISKDGKVGLGHRRLSIIDLSALGHQPMADQMETMCITYNGEIYNYMELRDDLIAQGVCFKSKSDTEVILHLYQREGTKCLDKLRGMFSFAIWNKKTRTLFAARDRLGMKPFYYYADKKVFLFSSEVRSLVKSGIISVDISREMMASFLRRGSVSDPNAIFEDINSLRPAHYLILRDGEVEERRYWNMSDYFFQDSLNISKKEAVDLGRSYLEDSVRKHCVSDVPVGIFLSGGVDSSALVSLARRLFKNSIKTISVNLPFSEFDEGPFALKVAEKFQTEHISMKLSADELMTHVESFLLAMDQPTVDGFNTYLVSHAAKLAGLKVCLSGLGGDELFGGYGSFWRVPQLYYLLKMFNMRGLTGAFFQWISNFSRMHKFYRLSDMYVPKVSFKNVYDNCRCVFSQREVYEILGVEVVQNNENILYDDFKGRGLEKQMISMFEMQGYMSNQLLKDSDVFGMAHSLEIRTPFVDHKLIELLSKIPDAYKYESNPNKNFLIQSIGDLPSEVYQRQKRGFSLPFKRWIQEDMHDHVKEVLISESLFNRDFVERELIEFDRGRRHWSRIWSLYILSRWVRKNSR